MKVTKKRKAILKVVKESNGGLCSRRHLLDTVYLMRLTGGIPDAEIKLLVDHGFLEEDGCDYYVITKEGLEAIDRTRPFYHTLNGKEVDCSPDDPCAPKKIRRKGMKEKYAQTQRRRTK